MVLTTVHVNNLFLHTDAELSLQSSVLNKSETGIVISESGLLCTYQV